MYESLPFDEATAPSLVSTGELPQTDQADAVTEAYERYRSNGDGMSRTTSPLWRAHRLTVRDLRGRGQGPVHRDR